jgi:hypothetical protein
MSMPRVPGLGGQLKLAGLGEAGAFGEEFG